MIPDPRDREDTSRFGVKGALETWTELPAGFVLKLDATAAHLFDQPIRINQLRIDTMLGWRVDEHWLVDIEAGLSGDRRFDSYSAGLAAHYRIGEATSFTLGAGYAAETGGDGLYGRGQFLIRY